MTVELQCNESERLPNSRHAVVACAFADSFKHVCAVEYALIENVSGSIELASCATCFDAWLFYFLEVLFTRKVEEITSLPSTAPMDD